MNISNAASSSSTFLMESSNTENSNNTEQKGYNHIPCIFHNLNIEHQDLKNSIYSRVTVPSSFDLRIVTAYRKHYKQFAEKTPSFEANASDHLHMDTLLPVLDRIEDHIKSLLQDNINIKILLEEIRYIKELKQVTPSWLLALHFRVQAAISTISDDEKKLIEHIPNPAEALVYGLTKDKLWKNLNSNKIIDYYKENRVRDLFYSDHTQLSSNIRKKVYDCLVNISPIYFPLLGSKVLSIEFLILTSLDNIYVMGMPSNRNRVHGIELSPLSFTVHDYLHGENDLKIKEHSLFTYTFEVIESLIKKNIDVDDAIRLATETANDKYKILSSFLIDIFEKMLEDKKYLAGLFALLHEFPSFSPEIFKKKSLRDVMDCLINECQKEIENTSELMRESDLLGTNIFNGECSKSDDQILEYTKKISSVEKQLASMEKIRSASVKRSDRFIDVSFQDNNLNECRHSMHTIFHKLENANDYLKLLNYAKYDIKKPDFTKSRDPFTEANSFLSRVQKMLINCILYLNEKTQQIIDSDLDNPLLLDYENVDLKFREKLEEMGIDNI